MSAATLPLLLALLSSGAGPAPWRPGEPRVTLGVDVLLGEQVELLAGRRVGLVTNASGVDGQLVLTADRLHADPRVDLVQLFAPEHGLRGALPAGQRVEDRSDAHTGLPVQGLFGGRSAPSTEALARVDVLVFDIQDVGSRTYTYVSTLGHAMVAAAKAGLPFVVLDRPNPQGGLLFEGPIREDRFKSFIGWAPLPVTHGMTVGELARFYNAELGLKCQLQIVPMKGWRRWMMWEDTGLAWVPTSPGIPHALHAHLYVATGMVGGVSDNVNEGVGTTMPFELVGASFVDPQAFTEALKRAALPGVRFRPTTWRPYYHRFVKQTLHGVQLVLDDPRAFRPLRTALTLWTTLEGLYPGRARFRGEKLFGRVWGNLTVKRMIREGRSVAEIEATWADALGAFGARRARALIYD